MSRRFRVAAVFFCASVICQDTEGAVNPTYTMYAVSLRGAEHLAANWNAIVR